MKVLRLGLSDDTYGTLADAERSWFLAERAMENLTGEPWETIHAPNWPSSNQADDVDAEIERSQPNMVVLCAATFWVAYHPCRLVFAAGRSRARNSSRGSAGGQPRSR